MITAEQKAKWVEALRSGKYKQDKYALHNTQTDTFCCLGVLCEVLQVPKKENSTQRMAYLLDEDYLIHTVPDTVIPSSISDRLVEMNDGIEPKSFNDIATWIEKNLRVDGQDTQNTASTPAT